MTVLFSRISLRDLREIRDYIAEDNPSVARRFVQQLRTKCEALSSTPKMGRARQELRDDLRSIPFKSYVIFYRLLENDQPQIMRVLHGARDLDSLF